MPDSNATGPGATTESRSTVTGPKRNPHQARRALVRVALGREPADKIIEGGMLVNVATSEIYASDVEVTSDGGGRFALLSARADRRLEVRHVPADRVPVELRGAGSPTRQVNNFCSPEAFAADRLIAVEALTPAGNCSSNPPHKHDEEIAGEETALEEIYYFEVAAGGLGYQRCYTSGPGREIDVLAEVRIGDAVLLAPRLSRPVDGGDRVRPVLPERDGRPRRTRLAVPR